MNRLLKIALAIFIFLPVLAEAHIPNQSYIFLRVYEKDGIEGRFEVNVNEINKLFDVELDKDASLEELMPYVNELKIYLLKNASFDSELGEHEIVLTDVGLMNLGIGNFLKIYFRLENTQKLPDNLNVSYSAIFEKDDTHTGFLIMEYNWKAGVINEEMNIVLDFGPGDTEDSFSLSEVSLWKGFVAMVKQGIWHIWIGLDHILFLLALILPSVVRRKKSVKVNSSQGLISKALRGWEPVHEFKPAFFFIVKVITFFTIAHTITLTLASLNLVNLPSRFVESVIALSIGLAAYHNIIPIFKGRDWAIAFIFGLFHGFGFASVLSDLGLTNEYLTLSLLGFNVGVELGQVAIIAMIFPILFLLRKTWVYNKILIFGSLLLIVISVYWGIERIFDISFGVESALRSFIRELLVSLGILS